MSDGTCLLCDGFRRTKMQAVLKKVVDLLKTACIRDHREGPSRPGQKLAAPFESEEETVELDNQVVSRLLGFQSAAVSLYEGCVCEPSKLSFDLLHGVAGDGYASISSNVCAQIRIYSCISENSSSKYLKLLRREST